MSAAIVALCNTVTNDVVVATSDAELRISDRGLGLGLEVVGGGAAEVKLETRPGWRFRDGSTSVTLNKAAGKSAKSPAIEGEGKGAEGYVPGVNVNDDGGGDKDGDDEGSVDHVKPILSLTASAPKVVAYSVLDGGTNVSISLSATVTTKGKHRKLDANGNVVKEEEFSPKRYVWKMTGAATGEAETDSASHTFTVNLTKGKGKKLSFSVVGKTCGICDGEVESDKATDSVEIDVYQLSISRPDYLGLDRTDAGRQSHVVKTATLSSDPSLPSSSSVEWTECGICEFVGAKNQRSVSYQNKDSDTASGEYLAERLAASVTLVGMDSSVVCATNFTVVKVDVRIDDISEDKEDCKGAFAQYVPDAASGQCAVADTSKMLSVKFLCCPTDLPSSETMAVSFSGPGELYEELQNGRLIAIENWNCLASEMNVRKFKLHGQVGSAVLADGLVTINHHNSNAKDMAVYTVVQIGALRYKLNGNWKNVPADGFTNVCLSSCIEFNVQANPIGSSWPTGCPSWGGVANGIGSENKVAFNAPGDQLVTVSCGNTLIGRVNVIEADTNVAIGWDHGYTCDNVKDDSITTKRQFEIVLTACADIANDVWHLRVLSITGGTDIAVHMGMYKTPRPGVNITNAKDGAAAIKDMLLESSTLGPATIWVTEDAIRAHETWHRDEWVELSEHYWSDTEVAIERISVPYHQHENNVASAVSAMRIGPSGADAKKAKYYNICKDYWLKLGDKPGDRPYCAGGVVLNPLIESIRKFGSMQSPVWTGLPSGLNAGPAPDHCYQPWLPYNP